jgi:carboxypeptidase PM20D1
MIGQLEALRHFVAKHGRPTRSLFLAFGHDEEVSGARGAALIAKYLFERSVQIEFVMDEGIMIVEDLFKGVDKAMGLIGVADKGYLTVRFSVNLTGGHSAIPDDLNSPILVLAEAVNRIKNNKQPSFLGSGPEKSLFEKMAVHLDFAKRVLLSNLWLLKPIAERFFFFILISGLNKVYR